MTDSSRLILGKIARSQFGSGDAVDAAESLAALAPAPRRVLSGEARLKCFLERLKINQIEVDVAASRSEAVKCIGRFIYSEHHTHRAVAGHDRRLAALPWRDGGVLVRFGVATPQDPVSISYARFGVAETGALVLYCNRDNPAANTWLPRDHIVVLDGRDLLSHPEDAWAAIRADRDTTGMPRGVTFIAGPSSTGDIVGHLVTGAHGPRRLHLIYLGAIPDGLLESTGHSTGATGSVTR